MKKRARRKFTKEFKAETVRLVRDGGKDRRGRARPRPDRVRAALWVASRDRRGSWQAGELTTAEREELQGLRREVELRMEREILKKAAAFFAKENA